MVLAAVDVVDGEGAGGAGIAGGCVGHAAVFEDRVGLGHRGGDGGVVVGAGDGDVDVMGCGAVEGCDDEVVVDDLSGGERVGQGLIEGVAPGPGGGVESVGAIGAGQGGGRLEMVLAAVDVVRWEGGGVGGECRSWWWPS